MPSSPKIPVVQYQSRPWGGTAFARLFGRAVPEQTGEAWELSVHPHGLSRTADGKILREMYPDLRLIFKLLDAREALSVQVHPSAGAEAKTEMWIVLDACPDAALYAGIRPGETAESVAAHIRAGTMEDVLIRRRVQRGDCVFLPGGTVHALGAGIVVAEIQQPGDTTYRLYDWGRPRELHIEQGLNAANLDAVPVLSRIPADDGLTVLADCPYFCAASFQGAAFAGKTAGKHTILFTETAAAITTAAGTADAAAYTTVFIPGDAGEYTVTAQNGVKMLVFQQNNA